MKDYCLACLTGAQRFFLLAHDYAHIGDMKKAFSSLKECISMHRLARIVKISSDLFHEQPAVCLACTELQLAFQKLRALGTFEYDGISYINSTAVHINVAFDFAMAQ